MRQVGAITLTLLLSAGCGGTGSGNTEPTKSQMGERVLPACLELNLEDVPVTGVWAAWADTMQLWIGGATEAVAIGRAAKDFGLQERIEAVHGWQLPEDQKACAAWLGLVDKAETVRWEAVRVLVDEGDLSSDSISTVYRATNRAPAWYHATLVDLLAFCAPGPDVCSIIEDALRASAIDLRLAGIRAADVHLGHCAEILVPALEERLKDVIALTWLKAAEVGMRHPESAAMALPYIEAFLTTNGVAAKEWFLEQIAAMDEIPAEVWEASLALLTDATSLPARPARDFEAPPSTVSFAVYAVLSERHPTESQLRSLLRLWKRMAPGSSRVGPPPPPLLAITLLLCRYRACPEDAGEIVAQAVQAGTAIGSYEFDEALSVIGHDRSGIEAHAVLPSLHRLVRGQKPGAHSAIFAMSRNEDWGHDALLALLLNERQDVVAWVVRSLKDSPQLPGSFRSRLQARARELDGGWRNEILQELLVD